MMKNFKKYCKKPIFKKNNIMYIPTTREKKSKNIVFFLEIIISPMLKAIIVHTTELNRDSIWSRNRDIPPASRALIV